MFWRLEKGRLLRKVGWNTWSLNRFFCCHIAKLLLFIYSSSPKDSLFVIIQSLNDLWKLKVYWKRLVYVSDLFLSLLKTTEFTLSWQGTKDFTWSCHALFWHLHNTLSLIPLLWFFWGTVCSICFSLSICTSKCLRWCKKRKEALWYVY